MNDKLEINKAIVSDFYNLAFNLKKPEEAANRYIGSYYRQHNPGAPDGKEPFIAFVNGFQKVFPTLRFEIEEAGGRG